MTATFVHRANLALAALLAVGLAGFAVISQRAQRERQAIRIDKEGEFKRLVADSRQLKVRSASPAIAVAPDHGLRATFEPLGPVGDLQRAQAAAEILRSGLFGEAKWPTPPNNSLDEGVDEVAVILGLDSGEKAALQSAVQAGREAFDRALIASAKVTREGDVAHIEVPEALAALRAPFEQTQAAIAAVLGPARYDAYVGIGASHAMEQVFNNWGLAGAVVRVRRSDAGYETTSVEVLPQKGRIDSRPNWQARTQRFPSRDALRAFRGPIEALVPDDL